MELVNGNFRRHSVTQKWRRKGGTKDKEKMEGRKEWEEQGKEKGREGREEE